MAHSQRRRLLPGFLLALLFLVGTAQATMVGVHPIAPAASTIPADSSIPSDKSQLLSTATTDYDWHGVDAQGLNNLAATANGASDKSLLDYPYTSAAAGQVEDLGDVIRHRGFGKALLIIIACGALIRVLTSPGYLKFIADVLDPKAF